MHIYSKSVHTNACNKQSDVCYLSYFHVHTAINILRCFGYPREHNFGLVLTLCTRKLLVRHRLLTRKLKLSVSGQSDKRCLASPRLAGGQICLDRRVTRLNKFI